MIGAIFQGTWIFFVGVSNLAVLLYIAFYLNLRLERPLLVFKLTSENKQTYVLKNIGKGSAVNILIKWTGKDEKRVAINQNIKCYSLGTNDEIKLWRAGGDEIHAVYEDIFKNRFISIIKNDIMTETSHFRGDFDSYMQNAVGYWEATKQPTTPDEGATNATR